MKLLTVFFTVCTLFCAYLYQVVTPAPTFGFLGTLCGFAAAFALLAAVVKEFEK